MTQSTEGIQNSGTALFVRRPILAFVLSALIVIAGIAAFFGVEIRELPDVDRPVVTINTDFEGASPETIDREITAAIEGAAGRVAGVKAISASSRFGSSRVTVEFADDVDLNVAAADISDAINRISNSLPDEAEDPRVVKADANADAVMRVSVTSSQRSPQDLTELVEDVVEERLVSVPGVADLQVYGNRASIFRVDIDQLQLASRGLTLADVRETLRNVAFDAPAGSLSSTQQSLVVRTTATVTTPEAFENLVIGEGVILGDVATVTLGPDTGASILRSNGQTGLGLGILRQAQSNTLDISEGVRAAVAELDEILPEDVSIFVSSDEATFIDGAIHEVMLTLGIAMAIVVAVIFLFLRDWRATFIPAVALPVSLIGTLAAIYLVGFSVNILTLLALLLATGMVVDDAIVVLENIVRRRSEGMGARAAAVLGTQQVFFAVVATTATLAAVFVPLSFLPGQTGGLFREFGFTLAISVMLSGVVALTLCPVLASRMLSDGADRADARGPMIWLGNRLSRLYAASLRACLAAPAIVLLFCVLFSVTAVLVAGGIRQEVTPPEDRAVALFRVSAPQGVSLDYTAAKMREIEDLMQPFRDRGEVTSIFSIAGSGGSDNSGMVIMSLAKWGDRARSQQEIVTEMTRAVSGVVGVRASAGQPNSLGIRGAGRGLTVALTGASYDGLSESAEALVQRLEENPAFGRVTLGYETTQPQLFVEVNRNRASDLGIDIDGLGEALQAVLDGRTIGTVFIDDASYDIKMLSTADPVNDPGDLERIFVATDDGQMVPISTFVTLQERAIAPQLGREAQMRSVEVTASLTPELALGDAYAELRRIAAEILPEDSRIVPLGEAAALDENSSGMLVTFAFAILVVFLVLAAQFESFVSAVIVMATVPLGLACAAFALILSGGSLNVYSQIGLVLLVGVMSKNGILIVEFANQLRDEGLSVRRAIYEASTIRLRPVMMTMIATVMGGVPLIFSVGAGAEARAALGWIIAGGLGLATVATLYVTPVAYLLLAGLSKPKAEEEARLHRELTEAARLPQRSEVPAE